MAEQPEHPEEEAIRGESERFLFAQFDVGGEIEEFLRSNKGRYIQGVALQEIQDSIKTLLNNNPKNQVETSARAYQQAQSARQAFQWMMEMVQAGRDAEYQLRELDDAERP